MMNLSFACSEGYARDAFGDMPSSCELGSGYWWARDGRESLGRAWCQHGSDGFGVVFVPQNLQAHRMRSLEPLGARLRPCVSHGCEAWMLKLKLNSGSWSSGQATSSGADPKAQAIIAKPL
jgi:hypothetical protein